MTEPEPETEYTDLEPVFFGDYSEAILLRSTLEANGYRTFIPSENIKVMDPFVTGANALDVTLLAPSAEAVEVRKLVEDLRGTKDAEPRPYLTRTRAGWLLVLLLSGGLGVVVWILTHIL